MAKLSFKGGEPWPVSWFSPGIMGWYAWIPSWSATMAY